MGKWAYNGSYAWKRVLKYGIKKSPDTDLARLYTMEASNELVSLILNVPRDREPSIYPIVIHENCQTNTKRVRLFPLSTLNPVF